MEKSIITLSLLPIAKQIHYDPTNSTPPLPSNLHILSLPITYGTVFQPIVTGNNYHHSSLNSFIQSHAILEVDQGAKAMTQCFLNKLKIIQ